MLRNSTKPQLNKASTQGSVARKIHLLYDVAMAFLRRIIRYPIYAHAVRHRTGDAV